MGRTLTEYDSLLALTHFKGHSKGGFGGSDKNIGIGCADGKIGKAMIYTTPGQNDQWDIGEEEFMERMTEAEHHGLVERIESRHGLRQLSYMKELGMGNDRYRLVDIDHEDKVIDTADAVKNLIPFGSKAGV